MSDAEKTYTYILTLYAGGAYVGAETEEEVPLAEYGYSDEGWDSLPKHERQALLDMWGEEFFWNCGYEYNAEVN